MYSLIGTARLNGIEPYAWLERTLEKLPSYPVNRKHPAISSGFLFLGVRAYVSTIRKRTRAHYFPRHFDRAHTADL
jgi:hypothetical protein